MSYAALDVTDIREAEKRIRPYLGVTPMLRIPDLVDSVGGDLWLKAESLQRTGSFKSRGALNWMLTAPRRELANGLVTVSAGNHAMALAWAARQRNIPVTVVMPEGASPLKVERTRVLGARVILHGTIQEAVTECHRLRSAESLTLVHPYDDTRVMAGQGTVGLELIEQAPDIDRVVCPIGGGGLISGVGLALKAHNPDIELIGVEPAGAATMANAWQHDDADAALESVNTCAGSLAPAVVGQNTFHVSHQVVDRLVSVSETSIRAAVKDLITLARLYVEPGAAVGLAALYEGLLTVSGGGRTALVVTGGNMDLSELYALDWNKA